MGSSNERVFGVCLQIIYNYVTYIALALYSLAYCTTHGILNVQFTQRHLGNTAFVNWI